MVSRVPAAGRVGHHVRTFRRRLVRGRFWWVFVVAAGVGMPLGGGEPPPVAARRVEAALSTQEHAALPLASAIRTAVEADRGAGPRAVGREDLSALYFSLGFAPLWLDEAGRLTSDAADALGLLAGASTEGLEPGDYAAATLAEQASTLRTRGDADGAVMASFDVRLSRSILRYLRELHTGRVDPRPLGFRIARRADEHDYPAMLREAVSGHRLSEAAASFTPPLRAYRELRTALAKYRALAADGSLVPPPARTAAVHPGAPYEGLAALIRLLVAVGDLAPGTPEPPVGAAYEGEIVEGVMRFQDRHGLVSDGVLGRGTFEALGQPLSDRVRQIELSLERLRWLPHLGAGPLIGVNIPMFRLWAWDSAPQDAVPAKSMGVIVGRALRTETPVFIDEMESVIFRPYWNVPASILRDEILPGLRSDPAFLDRQDMEIVAGQSDAARPVPLSLEALDRLARGGLRVRQRPGPRNALGLVKFVFPNDDDVYMHATPGQALFRRARRDFSHGCVRVEDPVGLAEWLLRDEGWTRALTVEAMEGPITRIVPLQRSVQVVLFYATALVVPGEGRVRFVDDIYEHDAALDRALAARSER